MTAKVVARSCGLGATARIAILTQGLHRRSGRRQGACGAPASKRAAGCGGERWRNRTPDAWAILTDGREVRFRHYPTAGVYVTLCRVIGDRRDKTDRRPKNGRRTQ